MEGSDWSGDIEANAGVSRVLIWPASWPPVLGLSPGKLRVKEGLG